MIRRIIVFVCICSSIYGFQSSSFAIIGKSSKDLPKIYLSKNYVPLEMDTSFLSNFKIELKKQDKPFSLISNIYFNNNIVEINELGLQYRVKSHDIIIGMINNKDFNTLDLNQHIVFGNIPNNQYVFVLDALDSLNYPYQSGLDSIQLDNVSYDAKTLIRSLYDDRNLYGGYLGSYSLISLDLQSLGGLASQEGWTSSNIRNLISEINNNGANFIPETKDIWNYLASNHDLIDVFGSDTNAALNHYLSSGAKEERVADNFDEWKYLASNPDLINIFFSGNIILVYLNFYSLALFPQ